MIDYALNLPEYILEISHKKPIFSIYNNDSILDFESGSMAFCKGVFVKNINALFSYNFNNANLNPDRNNFNDFDDTLYSNFCIEDCNNFDVIKTILSRMVEYYKKYLEVGDTEKGLPYEFSASKLLKNGFSENRFQEQYKAFLWKKAFEELFEPKENEEILGAVLKTDFEAPETVKEELKKYRIIELPKEWVEVLKLAGVKTDQDVIPEYIEEKISTSLTSKYGAELWDEQRIILDCCQNHLSTDSGGKNTYIRFQTRDCNWHDYREFEQFKDDDILRIKVSDDGIGYDSKSLGLFASVKGHEKSSGKWGEGLKMIATSALRNGMTMELRSRNWMAIPFFTDETLNPGKTNEESVERLNFLVRTETKEKGEYLKDDDNPVDDRYGFDKKAEMSSTTFVNPTKELIKQFRNIGKNILIFSDNNPMVSLDKVDVLSMVGGNLYIKNILIPGDHQLRYTYHLKDFDIETRDRDAIKKESMQRKIRSVLENVDNEQFIKIFLMEAERFAKNPGDKNFLEFETFYNIPTKTEQADLWIRVFQEYFGDNSCVRKVSDQNYEEVSKAQHVGLDTITLPDSIANALSRIEGRDGKKIPTYKEALNEAIENAIPVPEDRLTQEEKSIIQQLYKYNEVIKLNPVSKNEIKKIKVFKYDSEYTGKRAAGFAGYGNEVNICLDTLKEGLECSTDVFFHEVGHAETGADDPAPEFRDFQTRLLAGIVTRVFPLEKSIIDNSFIGKTKLSKVKEYLKNLVKKFSWKLATSGDKLDFEYDKEGDER